MHKWPLCKGNVQLKYLMICWVCQTNYLKCCAQICTALFEASVQPVINLGRPGEVTFLWLYNSFGVPSAAALCVSQFVMNNVYCLHKQWYNDMWARIITLLNKMNWLQYWPKFCQALFDCSKGSQFAHQYCRSASEQQLYTGLILLCTEWYTSLILRLEIC